MCIRDRGYYRSLYVAPARTRFSLLRCGRVRRLEARHRYVHVAAEYAAGELWGWMPEIRSDDTDRGCAGPDPDAAPNDYTAALDADNIGALEYQMKPGDQFYFVRHDDDRLECQHVKLARPAKNRGLVIHDVGADGSISNTHPFWVQGNRVRVYAYL